MRRAAGAATWRSALLRCAPCADPVPEARTSNMRHRPIGLGVQGLADAFIHLRMPFDSPEARTLNKRIFETIYHAALSCSCDLARDDGSYDSYEGSPVSKGVLQFDMCVAYDRVSPNKSYGFLSTCVVPSAHLVHRRAGGA